LLNKTVLCDSTLIKKDDNYFIYDNRHFGDIKANSTNPAGLYRFRANSEHTVQNIFIKGFYLNCAKVTDIKEVVKMNFLRMWF